MLHKGLAQNVDLREKLTQAIKIQDYKDIVLTLRERRVGVALEEKFGWYQRYWEKCYVKPGDRLEYGHELLQKL